MKKHFECLNLFALVIKLEYPELAQSVVDECAVDLNRIFSEQSLIVQNVLKILNSLASRKNQILID